MRDEMNTAGSAAEMLSKKTPETELTLRYSLDREITRAEERVQSLKDTKKRLEERGVLDCKVHDLRAAMQERY
jgi:hypothetical protein